MLRKKQESEKSFFDRCFQSMQVDGKLMSLGHILQHTAMKLPDNVALVYQGKEITYRQLYNAAVAFSKKLHAQGVQPRDRVLLMVDNSPAFYVGYFGIAQLGAVVVPLNTFLKEREIDYIVHDASPRHMVVGSEFEKMVQENGGKELILMTERDMDLSWASTGTDTGKLEEYQVVGLEADEMSALLYTSGTTGFPKGVMLSSRNIITNVCQALARFPMQHNERIFAILPLFHSFAQNGCIWAPFIAGCTVILVPKIERRFILEGLQAQPTIVLGVPALYGLLCLLKTAPLDSVNIFISGGDVLPDRIRSVFGLLYRRKICSGYGMTESSPMISGDVTEITVPTTNVGRPLEGLACAFKDEEGHEVAPGSIGQIWVKGDNVMLGYYNAPDMTSQVIKDGWLLTGDLGYLDPEGRLVISGRLKDLIIHKGFNIYPPEIENIILTHPNVLRVAVVGKPEVENGEVPVAFVQLRQEEAGVEKALRQLCLKSLAAYKVPREFFCSVEALPTTATGKVDKKKLRAQIMGKE